MVTDLTRRNLLKAALFGSTLPGLSLACASKTFGRTLHTTPLRQPALIGCSLSGIGRYSVVVADQNGQSIHTLPLPDRGHGVAVHPNLTHAVAFARRPGEFMMVFDYVTGAIIQLAIAEASRHFYGHGVYSADGQWLYVTQGVKLSCEGIIAKFDVAKGYKKVAEFSGFGIGPHEIILMNDGVLAVGVGGIQTDGRIEQNLDVMAPSLSYLSAQGDLLEQARLGDHHLSIRHLAHDGSNTVLCGQQYRGDPEEYPALIALHQRGMAMRSLHAEPEQWARFNHYIASIAASDEWILATSPPGNCYGIWSKKTLELVEISSLSDASGVVLNPNGFYVSSGAGKVVSHHYPAQSIINISNVRWDNHWVSIMS
jgi:hypothetical protein